jgi:superfamily II DNA or RNA helicase
VLRDYRSEIVDDFDRLAGRRLRLALVTPSTGGGKTVTLVALAGAGWQPEAGFGRGALLLLGVPR